MHFNYFFRIICIIFYSYHLHLFLYSFCASNPLTDYFLVCLPALVVKCLLSLDVIYTNKCVNILFFIMIFFFWF